jgi:hypothetical protein
VNVSPCGFKVKGFALMHPKNLDYQLTTCSSCTVEGKMGSTLGPNSGPRAGVDTHPSEFLQSERKILPNFKVRPNSNSSICHLIFLISKFEFGLMFCGISAAILNLTKNETQKYSKLTELW